MDDRERLSRRIGALEARIYPRAVRLGWRDYLEDIQDHPGALARVIQALDGQDAGYVVAYPEGDAVYVSDLAVLPKYRGAGPVLVLALALRRYADGRPLRVECRAESWDCIPDRIRARAEGGWWEDYHGDGAPAWVGTLRM